MQPRGFSLIELSIVMVILGLLVGGIMAGRSLIRASELRAISTEYQRWLTANGAFRDRYFALAGDMANATAFWGAQGNGDGLGTDCTDVESTSALTCNGNGNGFTTGYERFRYWQHLVNAGLVEGNYTGAHGAGGASESVIGSNVPRSKFANAGWSMDSIPNSPVIPSRMPWITANIICWVDSWPRTKPKAPYLFRRMCGTSIRSWTTVNPAAAKLSSIIGQAALTRPV